MLTFLKNKGRIEEMEGSIEERGGSIEGRVPSLKSGDNDEVLRK